MTRATKAFVNAAPVNAVAFQITALDHEQVGTDPVRGFAEHELGHAHASRRVIARDDNVLLTDGERTRRIELPIQGLALTVKTIHIGVHNDTAVAAAIIREIVVVPTTCVTFVSTIAAVSGEIVVVPVARRHLGYQATWFPPSK